VQTTVAAVGLLTVLVGDLWAQGHEMHMPDEGRWHASYGGTAFLQYVRTFDTRATHQSAA